LCDHQQVMDPSWEDHERDVSPANSYRTIFMDIRMPEMDGLSATREKLGKKIQEFFPIPYPSWLCSSP
ncbi:MAG: hypothetical protein ACE5FB_03490, partial [Candidatus Binatia bacterium]